MDFQEIINQLHERPAAELRQAWPQVSLCLSAAELSLWARVGKELAAYSWQGREVAQEYFRVSPSVIGRLPSPAGAALNTWTGCCRSLVQRAPDLAVEYLRASAAFLDNAEVSFLGRWAEEGEKLFCHLGRPTRSASLYFSGSLSLLSLGGWGLLEGWLNATKQLAKVDLQMAIAFLAESPSLLAQLPPDFRNQTLSMVALLPPAGGKQPICLNLLRSLPSHLNRVDEECRPSIWEVGFQIAHHNPEQALSFWETAPQCLHPMDTKERASLVSLGQRLAKVSWEGAFALFQHLPSIRREVSRDGLLEWMEEGLDLAQLNPSAGAAFFRLESHHSHQALPKRSGLSLKEISSILGPYIQALLGEWKEISEIEEEEDFKRNRQCYPPANPESIVLPPHLNHYSSREENFRLYKAYTAHQIGMHHFGTHRFPLSDFLSLFSRPDLARETFQLLEDARVDRKLQREYRGLVGDLEKAWQKETGKETTASGSLETALAELGKMLASLLREDNPSLPQGLPPAIFQVLTKIMELILPLLQIGATTHHTAWIVLRLYPLLMSLSFAGNEPEPAFLAEPLKGLDMRALEIFPSPTPSVGESDVDLQELLEQLQLKVASDLQPQGEGQPIPWELLKELIEAGLQLELKGIERRDPGDSSGLSAADLGELGIELPPKFPITSDQERNSSPDGKKIPAPSPEVRVAQERFFFYDEWDYLIRDYRPHLCRLREIVPAEGSLDPVEKALEEYASLIPLLRRRFQHLPAEGYQKLKRAPAGEELELEAILEALVDRKARQSPSEKVYIERKKRKREVSTLFLLDMSASTDEKLPDSGKRIIDVEREAMILMAEALEALKDEYAICGFSGYGRENVEFFVMKDFEESYSSTVKARMDTIRPMRSTRMGPAIRHAIWKMISREVPLKTLILLSDGYPQDHDYGEDRTSREYGLHDTKVALLEARRRGIKSFCVTVDPSGNDYLQQMCGGPNYLVIRDVASLPRELPRIYQGLTC